MFMRQVRAMLAALALCGALIAASAPQQEAHAQSRADLSGVWQGLFWGGGNQPTEFQVTLTHQGARLGGSVVERNGFGDPSFPFLLATLNGQIAGDAVTLVKTYDGTGGVSHDVRYEGRLVSPRRIVGTWRIGGASGSFELVR